MSYAQWQGRTWPTTTDEASLRVHLPPRDCPGALPEWDLELDHFVMSAERGPDGQRQILGALQLEISQLGLLPRRWHDLARQHVRADAAWYERTARFGPFGHRCHQCLEVTSYIPSAHPPAHSLGPAGRLEWCALDFEVRLGARDGLYFPCEIDAWLFPRGEFDRDEPETPEELATFGQGEPDLRIITRAKFSGGSIGMPRCGDDPWPQAQREILAALGPMHFARHQVDWHVHYPPHSGELVPRPGWRSFIHFWTAAEPPP